MKVLAKEKLSPHKSKTPEGYLVCLDAILARTGKQEYYASEVYEDVEEDKLIQIDRKPEEVFSEKTLASFENKPLTCEHPRENVTPDNYKDYSVGFVRDVRRGKTKDGQDVMLGNLIVTDPDCIKDIENGVRTELSCGYDCDITEGDHPEQKNIRGNHVALCEVGRAGIAKIVDTAERKPSVVLYDSKTSVIKYNPNINKYIYLGNDVKKKFDTFEEAKEFNDSVERDIKIRDEIAEEDMDQFNKDVYMAAKKSLDDLENLKPKGFDDKTMKKYYNRTLRNMEEELEDKIDEKARAITRNNEDLLEDSPKRKTFDSLINDKPKPMDPYQIMLGTFDDKKNKFIWHKVNEYSDLKKAYIEFKRYVNTQLKYTDEELKKVWKSGRLDVELRQGSKLLNWVGIYSRAAVLLTRGEKKKSEGEVQKKKGKETKDK